MGKESNIVSLILYIYRNTSNTFFVATKERIFVPYCGERILSLFVFSFVRFLLKEKIINRITFYLGFSGGSHSDLSKMFYNQKTSSISYNTLSFSVFNSEYLHFVNVCKS
jgi:hypothetical protein